MVLRGVWLVLLVLSWALDSWAEPLHWQPGPTLRIAKNPVKLALADGRLLTCPSFDPKDPCELVDPLTAERRSLSTQPGLLNGALPLDDGKVLLRSGLLLDPETGTLEAIPKPLSELVHGYAEAVSGGRAVFWNGGSDPLKCRKLAVFLGVQRGFQEVEAAPSGVCVSDVFDLGEGELLVARKLPARSGGPGRDVEFLLLKLGDWSWQRVARVPDRNLEAAFPHGAGFLVLVRNPSTGSSPEALFLERSGDAPRTTAFSGKQLNLEKTRPYGTDQFLLFTEKGALVWDPRDGRVTHVPVVGPAVDPWVVVRGDQLVMIDAQGHNATFVLSKGAAPEARGTPCDKVFTYAEAAVRSGRENVLAPKELMLAAGDSSMCHDWLDTQSRFPDMIQAPLEALATRGQGPVAADEDAAVLVACTLNPRFAAPLVARFAKMNFLGWNSRETCHSAEKLLPVLAATERPDAMSAALVEAAFPPPASTLPEWLVPLLRARTSVRRAAGPLLLAAQKRRAHGFDKLYGAVCIPDPPPEVRAACAQTRAGEEATWREEAHKSRQTSKTLRVFSKFGIATGIIGGLGTLAYFDRYGDGSRAVAVGSGAVVGAALGAGLAFLTAGGGGDTSGLRALLLAVPLGIAGGIAGGLVTAKTSSEPGTARFVSAVVPLSAAWIGTVAFTLDAL